MLTGKKPIFFWFCEQVFKVKDNQLIEALGGYLVVMETYTGSLSNSSNSSQMLNRL